MVVYLPYFRLFQQLLNMLWSDPFLKKFIQLIDPSILANFWPVSHLPFLEKVVFNHLQSYVEKNYFWKNFSLGSDLITALSLHC